MDSQPSMMACMWGSCQESFSSQSEIVGHVNLQHLPLPCDSFSLRLPINPTVSHPEEDSFLSCLWRDCNIYSSPDTIPGPSSGNHADTALNILASHLLQDHLGVPSPNIQQASEFHPPKDSDHEFNSSLPGPPVSTHSASPPPHHECSGMHVCHWQSCGQTFSSCDDLTFHITAMHVGAGKAQYECYWEGCTRHGNHSFTSKQKICRHLQVCRLCHPMIPPVLTPLISLIRDTDLFSARCVNRTFQRLQHCSSICGVTPKKVCTRP